MKTHTSVDNAFLGGGVYAIQPSGRMRVALFFRQARGGHFGACSAVKAVPPCNQFPVTFDGANFWPSSKQAARERALASPFACSSRLTSLDYLNGKLSRRLSWHTAILNWPANVSFSYF